MRPRVSIVIPAYNAEETINPLLQSIYHSNVDLGLLEAVVVDDKSKDRTIEVIEKYKALHKKLAIKIIALKNTRGPAHARNVGSKIAQGELLFFLDSDVVLWKNSIKELIRAFSDPDIHALTGVWDKSQKTSAFFPKFKALRDWSYWINERDPKNYYFLFSTRVAAIERELFYRLGGFDETYKAALVEDIELTYRIARRYAVIFDPKVVVHHEFEDFLTIARKYFWRSYYWSKIYRKRKKFDPVATTGKEALTTISAAGVVGAGILSFLSYMGHLKAVGQGLSAAVILFLFIHLWGVRKFLCFVAKEEGAGFAIKSFITGIFLYLVISAGAFFSMVTGLRGEEREKRLD